MDDDEVFDLNTIQDYELLSNEDGSVLIQDNCVVIKHNETKVIKMLPLSEEVLQALGLALVLDDDDVNVDKKKNEDKDNDDDDNSTAAGVSESDEKPEEESITIVFTDDDEAEASAVDTSQVKKFDKDSLQWSNRMVHFLLDLYERNQERFYRGTEKHMEIWKDIYEEMRPVFPELINWGPGNLQSKLSGLKRTYRGASDYLKDNLHTTKWPFFERMHHLMKKKLEMENEVKIKVGSSNTNLEDSKPNLRKSGRMLFWQKKWTPLLLDLIEENIQEINSVAFWDDIREKLVNAEPEIEDVTTKQVHQKFLHLQRSYRACKREGHEPKGELKSKAIFERMSSIYSADGIHSSDEEAEKAVSWSRGQTEQLLDHLISFAPRFRRGTPVSVLYAELSRRLRTPAGPGPAGRAGPAGGWAPTPRAVAVKIDALRRKLRKVMHSKQESNWVYYKRAQKAFSEIGGNEVWSRAATSSLLQLYAATNQHLDASGPKFWTELARLMQEKVGISSIDARKCEVKMQSLFLKYKSLLRDDPTAAAAAKQWPLFDLMHKIFGPKSDPWANRTMQSFLTIYQAHLPRLEGGEGGEGGEGCAGVWADVCEAINEELPTNEQVDPDDCRRKMLELKQKYCRLMYDEEAARAWPLYKRMSELFSTHLWSKRNVHLLLELYASCPPADDAAGPAGHAGAAGHAGPAGAWHAIADQFNGRSPSSAVSGAQCQTQMQVLKARYKAILAAGEATGWPFYEKMHEIFGETMNGDETVPMNAVFIVDETPAGAADPADTDIDGDAGGATVQEEYTWTREAVSSLLRLYRRHRHLFGKQPRRDVWRRIDREIAAEHPLYRPGKKGYGGWFKYLDIMTKYMDIKENRCTEKDWPFYEAMEAIFSMKRSHGSAHSGQSAHSGHSGHSAHSAHSGDSLEQLHDVLRARADRASLSEDKNLTPVEDTESSKAPKKRKKDSWPDDEEALLSLIDIYESHRPRLTRGEDGARVWRDVAAQLRRQHPRCDVTPDQCRDRLVHLRACADRMRRHGNKIGLHLRLAPRVFKRMQNISDDFTTAPATTNGQSESDILQAILHEMKRKNEINEKRCKLMERQNQARSKEHQEQMDLLKTIQETVVQFLGHEDDKSQVLRTLERNLEEIHK